MFDIEKITSSLGLVHMGQCLAAYVGVPLAGYTCIIVQFMFLGMFIGSLCASD